MIYFVNTSFQQNDGAIGHTCTNYTSIDDARMEYHAQLAAQYNPVNRGKSQVVYCAAHRSVRMCHPDGERVA